MVELNRNDVYRGVEGTTDNLEQWVIVRCPVNLGLIQEYVGISHIDGCLFVDLLVKAQGQPDTIRVRQANRPIRRIARRRLLVGNSRPQSKFVAILLLCSQTPTIAVF